MTKTRLLESGNSQHHVINVGDDEGKRRGGQDLLVQKNPAFVVLSQVYGYSDSVPGAALL